MTSTTGGSRAGASRPSMADVARLAGVSSQTVSRVSNGQSNVDERTRARVVNAMQTLGYRPNGAARALKSGRFHTIGVIMTTLATLGNMRTLDAIATEAARAGYSVMLMPIADPTLRGVSGAYQRLSAQAVDGAVIILEARLLDQAEFALPPGIPVVVIDSGAGPGYTVVDTDQALGARQATEHLLSLGHRQVWHIAGPETSFSAVHREQSWRRTLEAAGASRRRSCAATGPASPATSTAWRSAAATTSQRSSRPTTRWAWGHAPCTSSAGTSPVTSASSASTTWTWPLVLAAAHHDPPGLRGHRQAEPPELLRKVSGATAGNDTTIVPTELIVRGSTAAPRESPRPVKERK